MKEFKGTKGEWSSSYDNDSGNEGDCFHEFHSISSSHGYIGQIEREEDANLIAAAPELLEALKRMTNEYVFTRGQLNGDTEEELADVLCIKNARAAIAKALGEQP